MKAHWLALMALAAPLAAQRPEGWRIVPDGPAADSLYDFVAMPPGWHVTLGAGALLCDPAWKVEGPAAIEATIFLFPNSSRSEYGVFFGGSGLDGAERAYTSVVLRRDGQLAVFRHSGGATKTLVAWAAHPSIVALPDTGSATAKNVLRVEIGAQESAVLVNGVVVVRVPAAGGAAEGQTGLRAGAGTNLHVSKFAVLPHLPGGE